MTAASSDHKHFSDVVPEEVKEHARAASREIREGLSAMFPPEVLEHGRKARKEMLLAWRSMINVIVEKMEESKNLTLIGIDCVQNRG